jgi:hypothetical protein
VGQGSTPVVSTARMASTRPKNPFSAPAGLALAVSSARRAKCAMRSMSVRVKAM